jgi:hypothetical protein
MEGRRMTETSPHPAGPGQHPAGTSPPASGPRFPALTVQGWFALVFALLTVLVVAAAIVISQLLAQGRSVSAELDGSILPAQAQAYRLQGALVDQETGVRGFGITAQPSFLQPYTAGVATQADAAARLRALIGHDQLLTADRPGQPRAAKRAGQRAAGPEQAVLRPAAGPVRHPELPPGGGRGPRQQPPGQHPQHQ